MVSQRSNPVRDVTLLMMVRHMPDEDFMALCHRLMNTDIASQGFTLGGAALHGSSRQVAAVCGVCDGPVEDGRLAEVSRETVGMPVCKACIDRTLGTLFGPDPTAEQAALTVLQLAAGGPAQ